MLPARSPVALMSPGETSSTTPMNPIASPTTPLIRIGSSGRNIGAMTITNSGTVAFRIAARALSTDCSAQVISAKGIVMLTSAMTRRWP